MRIGFIGLGNMGGFMAQRLVADGHELFVTDLDPKAVAQLTAKGAQAVNDLAQFGHLELDALFTMLPAAQQVKAVYLGEAGLIAHLKGQPCVLVDCSTIDPQSAQTVAQAAQANELIMLDAPVSGGTVGAKQGSLTFMVGGPADTLERVAPLFDQMGKNTVHCGDHGHGQVAKIANNMLLGISMIGVAEAMSLGLRLGMQADKLAHVINHSSGRCWSSEVNNPVPAICPDAPASRDYTGGFASALMHKDLGLALKAAESAQQPVFLGAMAEQIYQFFAQNNDPSLDFSAVIKLYEANNRPTHERPSKPSTTD